MQPVQSTPTSSKLISENIEVPRITIQNKIPRLTPASAMLWDCLEVQIGRCNYISQINIHAFRMCCFEPESHVMIFIMNESNSLFIMNESKQSNSSQRRARNQTLGTRHGSLAWRCHQHQTSWERLALIRRPQCTEYHSWKSLRREIVLHHFSPCSGTFLQPFWAQWHRPRSTWAAPSRLCQ